LRFKIIVATVIAANAIIPAIRGIFQGGSPLSLGDVVGSPSGGVYGGIVSYDVFKPKLGSWIRVSACMHEGSEIYKNFPLTINLMKTTRGKKYTKRN